jgi:AcrR family transcriptional regulator
MYLSGKKPEPTEMERMKLATPARERRSHAERTAETRAKIIAAVVESIAEVGFPRTTASEISRRAGVTWGAVQHHFGGKDGILLAVVEDSFNRFADSLADIEVNGVSLEERVESYVDRAWRHFSSPHYRCSYEILANYTGPEGTGLERDWQDEMFRAWNGLWTRLFADAGLSRGRNVMLAHYTISVLSGLALMKGLSGPATSIATIELKLLKDTLSRELTAGGV